MGFEVFECGAGVGVCCCGDVTTLGVEHDGYFGAEVF